MDFNQYIGHPELLTRETLYSLRSYVAMYPCHQAARLLMLQNLYILHDPTFDEELHTAAFFITDRTALFNLVEARFFSLAKPANTDYPVAEDKHTETAEQLIDNFVDNADDENKPTVVDATVDYMAYVERKKSMKTAAGGNADKADEMPAEDNLIDNFLENDGGKITIPEQENEERETPRTDVSYENDKDELQTDYYTESLAKVYIKQGNYPKALEIIRQLNLNNSEKNAYFADQMRFLEKAIALGIRK